ncbi:MAG: hypothetical protein R2706_14925 [Acidimicrobiales bacterium]
MDKVGEAAGVTVRSTHACIWPTWRGWSVDEVLIDNDLSAYSGVP